VISSKQFDKYLPSVKVILSVGSTSIWHRGINQGVMFRHSEGTETIPSAIYFQQTERKKL